MTKNINFQNAFENFLPEEVLKKRKYERKEDIRGAYFRDLTAILHSYPFRRLRGKTQVFFSPRNDHICTRMEHSLHVASIASTIAKALGLDTELAWAIGLGHDIGHPPFGHLGEKIIATKILKNQGFTHEKYSYRVLTKLTNYGRGLNLTYAVLDGILYHCGESFEKFISPNNLINNIEEDSKLSIKLQSYPSSFEGCIVRMSDKIAYVGRDLEDALTLKLIFQEQIPINVRKILGIKNSQIIDALVNDLINDSFKTGKISFSDKIYEVFLQLIEFNYKNIYLHEKLKIFEKNFSMILLTIYNYLSEIYYNYKFSFEKYLKEKNFLAIRFSDFIKKMYEFYNSESEKDSIYSPVIDYIAGMTDSYAIESAQEILLPKRFHYDLEIGSLIE
ncbi:MAG: deoxyguanosinetriphosphate triphosphohydrolase family protein [Exilispira sp.]